MELSKVDINKKFKEHHALTEGRHDYEASQLDVMFLLLACLDENDEPNKKYYMSVKDIENITGRRWDYVQIMKSNQDLQSRVFTIRNKNFYNGSPKHITLFSEIQYLDNEGAFYIIINPSARQFFFQLKNNYTLFELKSILECTSKFAKRLYVIACKWRTAGGHTYDIFELREMLGLRVRDKKGNIILDQYLTNGELKKYVFEVAKKQINEKTDIVFDYEFIKKGRTFDKIKLYCGFARPNLQLQCDFQKSKKENEEYGRRIQNITVHGITLVTAEIIAEKCWNDYVNIKNNLLEEMKKGKIIEDKAAYIVGVLKEKEFIEIMKICKI